MKFTYGKQDLRSLERCPENCFLMTNGLGGYASVTAAYSVVRCDQGILVAAEKAPNVRINMVHRVRETLAVGTDKVFLSTQEFADSTAPEEGYRHLSAFTYEYTPCWTYHVSGVEVKRRCTMEYGTNTAALIYEIENRSRHTATLRATPFLKFAPKEQVLERKKPFSFRGNAVTDGSRTLYLRTDGDLKKISSVWQTVTYPEDEKDGRPEKGKACACCEAVFTVAPGERKTYQLVFSTEYTVPDAFEILRNQTKRLQQVEELSGLQDSVARQLVLAADAFIARRDSTDGKTILAGYPLFSDWGRDTMIALPGCCLSTRRFEDARSILRTFLAYEKDGLVPNLFPEGETQPMYNTVDAALLLIDAVWQYHSRTGDEAFVAEAYPVLERIIAHYQKGTHHAIGMDTDGLIFAGSGLDQVTWMDVCVNGILPTPRHGKPVEINAYWYNALRIMERFAAMLGREGSSYGQLAETVKESFLRQFYMADKGYLKDVISGTSADEQLRCNQIWAVSMAFTMLDKIQAKSVVDAVFRHLYTPCGLRTLSPEDPEYHPSYGGPQVDRDMAYHQGTAWVFPLGAYYLARLKTCGYTPEACREVRDQLEAMEPMLREGCAGQLPEIYEGGFPTASCGCFAQAWSVGEILRVYETLEKYEV